MNHPKPDLSLGRSTIFHNGFVSVILVFEFHLRACSALDDIWTIVCDINKHAFYQFCFGLLFRCGIEPTEPFQWCLLSDDDNLTLHEADCVLAYELQALWACQRFFREWLESEIQLPFSCVAFLCITQLVFQVSPKWKLFFLNLHRVITFDPNSDHWPPHCMFWIRITSHVM